MLSFIWNVIVSIFVSVILFLLYRQLPKRVRIIIADCAMWVLDLIARSCDEGLDDLAAAKDRLKKARANLKKVA